MPSPHPTPPSSPPRRRWIGVVVVLVSTVAALAAAEALLRWRDPFGFRTRGSTLVLPVDTVYDIRADAASRSDQLDPHVVHSKNSLGFRGPEPPPDFAAALTVVAVGGSTTECFYLADGRDWPARLAAHLAAGREGPRRDELWINNAGLDGHSTFGHLLLTRQALVPLAPDVTLYLVGVNDMFTDAPRDHDRIESLPLAGLVQRSALVSTAVNLLRWNRTRRIEDLGAMPKPVALRDRPRATVEPARAELLEQAQEPRLAAFRQRLEELVALNRRHGMEPVLLTQPTLLGGVDRRTGIDTRTLEVELWETLDGELAWRLLERYNDVTRQVGRDHGVLTIDLAHELPKDSTYFYDFWHFTNEGADRVGEIVAAELGPWLDRRHPEATGR